MDCVGFLADQVVHLLFYDHLSSSVQEVLLYFLGKKMHNIFTRDNLKIKNLNRWSIVLIIISGLLTLFSITGKNKQFWLSTTCDFEIDPSETIWVDGFGGMLGQYSLLTSSSSSSNFNLDNFC